MSNVNIKRAVENIRANTTVYTPVVEMLVNSIQSIDETHKTDGKVRIRVTRSDQTDSENLADITGFTIEDNGVGFTKAHRDSFDTLYSDQKITEGGKGFGRFTCLKYFEDLSILSIFSDGDQFKERRFLMGKDNDIIVGENISDTEQQTTGTIVTLSHLKKGRSIDKKLSTIARNLVERILPYFISKDYHCPEILLSESDGGDEICLNDFVRNELSAVIQEMSVEKNDFTLPTTDSQESFHVRIFKIYKPRNQKSKISLVAHKREVSGSLLNDYVPEFEEEFYEKTKDGEIDRNRNYIIKAYVFGTYLDRNVSLERGGFEFQMKSDLLLGISQSEIEANAALVAQKALGSDISLRQEKKKVLVQSYVDEHAPWHKEILSKLDLGDMPLNPSNEDIEIRLQTAKLHQEVDIKRRVAYLLSESDFGNVHESVMEIVNQISDNSRNDLIHYIALRRKILDIFDKSLTLNDDGVYTSEGLVHDIVFPRKGDTETTHFEDHNLWILDERLNFTKYLSSDIPLEGKNTERPDLIAYDKRVLFRGDNEASNPITIFEFKKPQRDDFVNPSSTEDPVQQIVRYVNNIKDGKYKTPEGRNILVADNTPFYGYVVCDLTKKVQTWLEREKDFKPMPDRLGWFQWIANINLYVEVVSWDKVLKDAKMRNQIFFKKLGI